MVKANSLPRFGPDADLFPAETDTDDEPTQAAPPKPVFRKPGAAAQAAKEESSKYETDSEEEEQARPLPAAKPIFVPK